MSRFFLRQFLAISLLVSIPLGAMQPRINVEIAKYLTTRYSSEFLKKCLTKNKEKAPLAAMVPAAADVAKEPSTITTAVQFGAAAVGSVGLVAAAPPLIAVAGIAGIFTWMIYSPKKATVVDKTTFIAHDAQDKSAASTTVSTSTAGFMPVETSHKNSDGSVVDPVTQFNVYPGTARYEELTKKSEPKYAVVEPAVDYRKEEKKKPKAQLEKEAAKEAARNGGGSTGGPKKPEDDKKEWKKNPHDFKQRFKKSERVTENYDTHRDGSLRLKDNAKNPLRTPDGKPIEKMTADHRHSDIEAYIGKEHVGSVDPVTHEIYKKPVYKRTYAIGAGAGVAAGQSTQSQTSNESQAPLQQYLQSQQQQQPQWQSYITAHSHPHLAEYQRPSWSSGAPTTRQNNSNIYAPTGESQRPSWSPGAPTTRQNNSHLYEQQTGEPQKPTWMRNAQQPTTQGYSSLYKQQTAEPQKPAWWPKAPTGKNNE